MNIFFPTIGSWFPNPSFMNFANYNKRLMGYFEFLYESRIICLPLNISEKLHWQHLIVFIFSEYNAIPTHPEEQQLPFKQTGTTTIFSFGYQSYVWSRSDPFFWQNPCSGCNSGIDLVVALECTFFQLCVNAKQISVSLARFKRGYVQRPAVILTSHTSYATFLLDVRCAVQSGHVPFFAAVCPR